MINFLCVSFVGFKDVEIHGHVAFEVQGIRQGVGLLLEVGVQNRSAA